MGEGSEPPNFSCSRKITNHCNECTVHKSTTRIEVGAGESTPWYPEVQEVINEWTQIVIGRCERWLLRPGDDTGQKHVFRPIALIRGEIQAYQGYDADRGLFPCLLIGVGVEEVYAEAEYIAALITTLTEMFTIRPLESSKKVTIKDVVHVIWG